MSKKYSVYSITYNNNIIYIGYTSLGKHRWTCHKTKARNDNQHSRPIHDFMRDNTIDLQTFPEYSWNVLCVANDEHTAKELELYFYNKYNLDKKQIRPISKPNDLETR